MLRELPNTVPKRPIVGDSIIFLVSGTGYSPDDWDLKFYVCSSPPVSFEASASGQDFSFNIVPNDSKELDAEEVLCALIFINKTSDERKTYAQGLVSFLPDPAVPLEETWAMRTLRKVNEAIEKLASSTNQELTINGEHYTKKDLVQLMNFQTILQNRVDVELKRMGRTRRGGARTIYTRFVS